MKLNFVVRESKVGKNATVLLFFLSLYGKP